MNDLPDDSWWWGQFALLIVLIAVLIWLTDHLARRDARQAALHEADLRARLRDRNEFIRGKCEGIRECADWMHAAGYLPRRVALPAHLLERQPRRPRQTPH